MAKGPTPNKVEIYNVGSVGVILDMPGHLLPPEAWTDAKNVQFKDTKVSKAKGTSYTFNPPSVAPAYLLNVFSNSQSYWVYPGMTKIYVYEGGVHTNITRQTASVDVNYTPAQARDWNGGVLGGIPVLNNFADIPQYWLTASAATKMANLTNWPSTLRARVVRPFGQFLVALNCVDSGTAYPHMFWWSHPAQPGSIPTSWDYTDASKDAGRKELTDIRGGVILDGLMLQDMFIIYKENSTHAIKFIGGNEIMGSGMIFATSGLLAARCVTPFQMGSKHFVVTGSDFITHSGQPSSAQPVFDGKLRDTIYNDIDNTNYPNSFCFDNAVQSEVWFCYPTSGQTRPNKAVIWNYKYNTFAIRDFAGMWAENGIIQDASSDTWATLTNTWEATTSPWGNSSRSKVVIADFNNTKFIKLDDGESFNGTAPTAYVERTGLAITGRDRQGQPKADFTHRKLLSRIWPKVTGTAPITVRAGSQESRDGAVTWQSIKTFDPINDLYVDVEANGLLLAVRFEATSSLPWTLEGYDLEVTVLGEH